MKLATRSAALMLALVFAGPAAAEDANDRKEERRGPPPVAIEACAAADDGDSCSFEGRRGETLSGKCVTDREEVMACRPDGGPPRLRPRKKEQNDAEQVDSK